MISKAEQRRRYKKKYPEKVKEERRRYLDRKIKKKIEQDNSYLDNRKNHLIQEFNNLTRLMYNDILPRRCENCGDKDDLHIHHKRYVYPIVKEDLIRLCRRCHIEEHQKAIPPDIPPERA